MIALVIPFIDTFEDFVKPCIEHAVENSRYPFELIMIDNGSDEDYRERIKELLKKKPAVLYRYIKNEKNLGVVQSFNQGIKAAYSDVVCFIHSDVLLQEVEWEKKIEHYFDNDPKLGLAGLLGASGVAPDGGRMNVVSNMQGKEWGGCPCHALVAMHHGNHLQGMFPATVLDGVGLFFRKSFAKELQEKTTALDPEVRPPHHWYDRNITLYAVSLGWHVATIGVGFDHFNGATANHSDKYRVTAQEWFNKRGIKPEPADNLDLACYNVGLRQFTDEWAGKLPCMVNISYEVQWGR